MGGEYLTGAGLVRLAHDHGIERITTDMIWADHERGAYIVRATATGSRGTYTGLGDASPANLKRNMHSCALRMAETRAVSRALRTYTGLGLTTTDELPGVDTDGGSAAPVESADISWPDFWREIEACGVTEAEFRAWCELTNRDPSGWDGQKRLTVSCWVASGGTEFIRMTLEDVPA
tara:strand:+ start:3229 stop:3759 length:531 start_codon:yes stop_codon:yes gene_type:complete